MTFEPNRGSLTEFFLGATNTDFKEAEVDMTDVEVLRTATPTAVGAVSGQSVGANQPQESNATKPVLVVNSAFLQEIKDSNPDLWHAMHQLRQLCESEGMPSPLLRSLVRLLDDLRDRWAMQFALEESYGYLKIPAASPVDPSADRFPRWKSDLAEAAQSQHCNLYLMISDLAEQAEELQYRGVTMEQLNRLIERARDFDCAVREHEQREHALIEDAFPARQ